MSSLNSLGLKYGTDKSSAYHDYLNRLEPYLLAQPRPLRLLEIGVMNGRSIKMWLEYFPESNIFGVDIDPQHDVVSERFTFYHQDATDPSFWSQVGTFNVVVDDGDHAYAKVKKAYDQGFNHLEPGGLWIIEDTCKMDYHGMDLMRDSATELQGYDADYCGNPRGDRGRFSFIHFFKGLIIIGKK